MPVWQAAQQRDQPAAAEVTVAPPPSPVAHRRTAADYRLPPGDIDASLCLGRRLGPDGGDKDWFPAVYIEAQCDKKPVAGSTLCKTCQGRKDAFNYWSGVGIKIKSNSLAGQWNGLITEAPPPWCHMLGTAWAEKVKWRGDAAVDLSDTSSTSESGSASSRGRARLTPEVRAAREAEKAAEKEARAAAKAAAKEARAAEKAAEKEARAAAKAAAKEARAVAKKILTRAPAAAFLLPMGP
jgi:hypothetical protein